MRRPTPGELAVTGLGVIATAIAAWLASRKITAPGSEGLSERVRRTSEELIPAPPAVLGRGDPRWDEAMGGRTGGEGVWRYYGEGYGTTCGVVAAYVAHLAGLPVELINRDPPEGSGFKIGEHIARLYQGARALGWLRSPTWGAVSGPPPIVDLRPGDIYCTVRSGAMWNGQPASGEHVGIILSVGEPDASGARKIVTADGGQRDANGLQCAKRRDRVLTGDKLSLGTGPATVVWWIRPGGES